MTPEMISLLSLIIAGLVGFIARKQQKDMEQIKAETKVTESRAKAIESDALSRLKETESKYEVIEKTLMLLGDTYKRHAEIDERHIDEQSKQTETQNRLATAIESLTSSTARSQSWQEKRSEDYLATADIISERTATIERVGADTREKVDTVVTTLTTGLEQIKQKLDSILLEAQKNPNKDALERIEKEIAKLLILAKPLSDAASRTLITQPLPELTDTRPLPELAETPKPETKEPKENAA